MSMGANLGSATFTVKADGIDQMRQQFSRMKGDLDQLANASSRAATMTERQWKGVSMTMLQVGYVADDLQYGFRAIVNNIAPIGQMAATAFGASTTAAMAFGGAVSVIGVGINQLVNHWGDLMDRLNASWSDKPVEHFRRIREAAEEATKAWAELSEAPTKMQAKTAKAVEEAIIEAPASAVAKAVEDAIKQDPILREGGNDAEKAAIAARRQQLASPEGRDPAHRRNFEALLEEQYKAMAERLVAETRIANEKGDPARRTLRGLRERHPGLFPGKVGEAVDAMDPKAVARQEEFGKQVDARKEVQKRIKQQEKEHQEALEERLKGPRRLHELQEKAAKENAKKFDDMLNKEGEENEKATEEKRKKQEKRDQQTDMLNKEGMHNQEHMEHEQKKEAHDADAERKRRRHLLWQARDLGGDLRDARKKGMKAEFMGFGDFWKSTQQNILNGGTNDVQKRQLDVQEKIFDLINNNPMMKQAILAAVAGNPP